VRRDAVLSSLLAQIETRKAEGLPCLAGIDGVDASGKTCLADELAELGGRRGMRILRASIDGFHNPRELRYRLGADSPEGYYRDSFDYRAMRASLLDPLKEGREGRVVARAYDIRAEAAVAPGPTDFDGRTILVFEGVFLQCAELERYWDFLVYVHAGFDTVLRRAASRDAPLLGSPAEVERRYLTRYIPGQQLYIRERSPIAHARAVVANDDPRDPELVADEGRRRELEREAVDFRGDSA
jgi:uridine kinase